MVVRACEQRAIACEVIRVTVGNGRTAHGPRAPRWVTGLRGKV